MQTIDKKSFRRILAGMSEKFDYTKAYREHGNEIYLEKGETFEEVVARDALVLAEHGVTAEEIGRSLRRLVSTWNTFHEYRVRTPQSPVPGLKITRRYWDLGYEPCPYLPGVTSNIDWRISVDGMDNGNKAYHPQDGPTYVSDMLPDMIERLGFFEGSVYYGIKPEWAIAVHKLFQGKELPPYVPEMRADAWDCIQAYFKSWEGQLSYRNGEDNRISYLTEEERDVLYVPKQIKQRAIQVEQISPHVTGYVAPGDIDFKLVAWSRGYYAGTGDKRKNTHWGLLEADEETIISPNATLMSLPLDKYISHLTPNDLSVIRVFPYFDKQVA